MKIFEESKIASITFKNRILRSATHEGMGDKQGSPVPEYPKFIERLAKGGVGGIILGNVGVSQSGRSVSNMIMFDDDSVIDSFAEIIKISKKYNVPVFPQLNHGGGHCISKLTGHDVVAPSACTSKVSMSKARALREDEIHQIIDDFASAVERAKKAGFAGAQLHAAHGYLLSQFLSPMVNRRKDKWGGSTENRFRIIGEIIKKARERVGDYPILAKYSAHDDEKKPVTVEEGIEIARLFQDAGCDAIEVSCGGFSDGFNSVRVPQIPADAFAELAPAMKKTSPLKKKLLKMVLPLGVKLAAPLHNYNIETAEKIRKAVDIPVIVVGGIRRLADIEDVIDNGRADYVSMSRPFVIEPGIVNKFKDGSQAESRCIDCAFCLFGCMSEPLHCYYGKVRKKR